MRSTPTPWLIRLTVNVSRSPPPLRLDALAPAFDDLQVHPHRVAGPERRHVAFQLLPLNGGDFLHPRTSARPHIVALWHISCC